MYMELSRRLAFDVLAFIICLLLLKSNSIDGSDSDIACLKSIKESLKDPNGYLNSTWNFNNKTDGFICTFIGIDCWQPTENRVLNIRLSNMGLKGSFPTGIANCTSVTGVDLSSNELNGSIPSNISNLIPYVTSLVLSSNEFSGEIPVTIANCTFLNKLMLDHNRLSGHIPSQIGQLSRLQRFSVANNLLDGPIPSFYNVSSVTEADFANNTGLCGSPLVSCPPSSKQPKTGIIVGAAVGGVTLGAVGILVGVYFIARKVPIQKRKKEEKYLEGNEWAKAIKGTKKVKVSMFEDSVSKIRLNDLMRSTNNFSKDNIIGMGRTGTLYRATLEDGNIYTVKRLHDSQHSEKEFASEMATLGSVKQTNLVPLLGYCVSRKERFLIYKHMPNGNLHDQIHASKDGCSLKDWPLRLRIAIGAARGLAWLHHNCNPRIIHRNISSKCILLDEDFEPMISGFGLARLMNPVDTHLSTFVNGEFGDLGYVAPEYARTLVATPKGDVYSFGVVLLELITCERPTFVARARDGFKGNLVEWVMHLSSNSNMKDAIDGSLVGKGFDDEVFQFLKVACNCVSEEPKERPSMFEVYQFLKAIGEPYHFSFEDETMLMANDDDDVDDLRELIVIREETKHE
ncbi:hypothetical protein V2J09_022067 [Rumex salicifolius]